MVQHTIRKLLLLAAMFAAAGCSLRFSGTPTPQAVISGAPTVTIAAPQLGSIYLEGVSVIIQALIANAGADIARVNVAIDGQTIADLDNPNPSGQPQFSIAQGWPAQGNGSHTVTITAYRADGSASAPASVEFIVLGSDGQSAATANEPSPTPSDIPPTAQPPTSIPPTAAPEPTTAAPAGIPATVNQPTNVRRGPGSSFNPPIGTLTAGDTVQLTARTSAGNWYRIIFNDGDGWVSALVVSPQGDISTLPVDDGPPPP